VLACPPSLRDFFLKEYKGGEISESYLYVINPIVVVSYRAYDWLT